MAVEILLSSPEASRLLKRCNVQPDVSVTQCKLEHAKKSLLKFKRDCHCIQYDVESAGARLGGVPTY